jgi:hypothetical protein
VKQDAEHIAQQIAKYPHAAHETIRERFQAYLVTRMEDHALAKLPEPWADYRQAWDAFRRDGNLDQFREAA